MKAAELLEIFNSFPEIQILRDCSHRLRAGLGLRGGVLRNVMMSEGLPTARYDSLYNFVDPFGDIDIVLPNEMDQNRLVRTLFAEVPFADCHLWDFQTQRSAEQVAIRSGTVAADRLILWIDWIDAKLSLGAIGSDVETILNRPAQGERTLLRQVEVGNPAVRLLQVIKYARIQLQSPAEFKSLQLELGGLIDRLREPFRSWKPARRQPLWRGVIPRLEIEMAQLLLNAAEWPQATSFLRQVSRSVSGEWLAGSDALTRMFNPEVEGYPRVGVAVYRPRARASLRLDIMTAGSDDGHPGDPNWSRIPWTRLTLTNLNETTCCPYSDFEEGIAVIAWRNSKPEATLQDEVLQEQEYGAVARPAVVGQRMTDVSREEDLIPISGYTRKGKSIAIRIDPAYLKLITGGRYSTFLVGLVPVSSSGNIRVTEQALPKALSPQGEISETPVEAAFEVEAGEEETAERQEFHSEPQKVRA